MYVQLESWYDTQLMPLVSEGSDPEISSSGAQNAQSGISPRLRSAVNHKYKEILLAILDCVSNAVYISLSKLAISIESEVLASHHKEKILRMNQTMDGHFALFHSSLLFVRHHSKLAAKPLEVGLQLIWTFGEGHKQLQPA
jgi:hypothetical protein